MKKQLYAWQEECLNKWFTHHGRGMVQAVTGSGKTLLAVTAAERLQKSLSQQLRVKIVVPTSALMQQWHHVLKDFLAVPRQEIGLRSAGCKPSANCQYMIYVINSARYELARQILSDLKDGAAVLLIADECHRYESEQNRLIFEFLPYISSYEDRFFSLGLSATLPSGPAQTYLASVLGPQIYNYDMKQAASMHTICKYDIYHIGLRFFPEEEKAYLDITEHMNQVFSGLQQTHPLLNNLSVKERFDLLRELAGSKNRQTAEAAAIYMKLAYKRKSLVCLASSRISCAHSLVNRLSETEKIIIFSERIRQAEELYTLLQEQYPGRVGRYHSQMGQQANRNALDRFRDGSIRILIACKAIDEGIDVPDAAIGIILSGTCAKHQRIQRLGRILRRADGKERASLYYLHLTDTTEDDCFLPEGDDSRIFDLDYLADTREFLHPPYDQAAQKLLEDLQNAGADAKVLAEAQRCLRLGSVRSDWLRDSCDPDRKIKEAKYVSDKNYWICMKKMRAIVFYNP